MGKQEIFITIFSFRYLPKPHSNLHELFESGQKYSKKLFNVCFDDKYSKQKFEGFGYFLDSGMGLKVTEYQKKRVKAKILRYPHHVIKVCSTCCCI